MNFSLRQRQVAARRAVHLGGRARTAQVFLSMDALCNCKPPLQEDRSHELIHRTTKLCFEVHQPNLTAEAACLPAYRHHPIIPQTSERRREGFFSRKASRCQLVRRRREASLVDGEDGGRAVYCRPAAIKITPLWRARGFNTAKISMARGSSNCDRARPCEAISSICLCKLVDKIHQKRHYSGIVYYTIFPTVLA